MDKKQKLLQEIKEKKKELKKARQVIQLDELKARKRVLRRLGYSTPADVIETKGRVACEISTADEVRFYLINYHENLLLCPYENLNLKILSCF